MGPPLFVTKPQFLWQKPKKGINIKNLGRNPHPRPPPPKGPLTPQSLYVWGLFSLQNTGKRPTLRISKGGLLGAPTFFMLNFFACLINLAKGTQNGQTPFRWLFSCFYGSYFFLSFFAFLFFSLIFCLCLPCFFFSLVTESCSLLLEISKPKWYPPIEVCGTSLHNIRNLGQLISSYVTQFLP